MTGLTPYGLRKEVERLVGEDRVPEDVLQALVTDYGGPQGPAEMEQYLQEHAGLLHEVGSILIDRRENDDEGPLIWEYLYENLSDVYDRFGKLIDEVEVECFG